MKKLVLILTLVFLTYFCFANTNLIIKDSTKAYHNAILKYENQEYGKALKYSEDAIQYRKTEIENEKKILTNALSPKRVQAVGDDINAVLKMLDSRNEFEAIKIIKSYYKINENSDFEESITNLVSYIDSRKEFPEAQKLIGDIYRIEGEYDFAENYYLLALKNEYVLDIPDEKYEILYMLADISKLKNESEELEKRLLSILIDDTYFNDINFKKSLTSVIKKNRNDSLEKFFMLYRANRYYSLNAYNELCEYYLSAGETEKAFEVCCLSVITSFTKMNQIISDRDSEYEYETLSQFFETITHYPDVINWGTKNSVWKSFNTLAEISHALHYDDFTRQLLYVLVKESPEKYWQENAVLLLSYLDQ